jgi:DNA-binding NarL/FixJ family response regulator
MTRRGECLPVHWQPTATGSRGHWVRFDRMSVLIGVAGRSPTWRRGIDAVLGEAGYQTVALEDFSDWTPGLGGAAIVTSIEDATGFESIRDFCEEHPHLPVVVLMAEVTLQSFAEAIRAGAATVVEQDAPTETIVAVLESALDHRPRVPRAILRTMAHRVPVLDDAALWLTGEEAEWLRAMAGGLTVAELSEQAGYSERAMFRNLKTIYSRLGASNRTEALLWASRHGVLDSG